MFQAKTYYLKENGKYVEYSAAQYAAAYQEESRRRWFIPAGQGILLEVPHEEYVSYYREKRREKYIREEAEAYREISYHALDREDMAGEEFLRDTGRQSPEEEITHLLLLDKLKSILKMLSDDERRLLDYIFQQKLPERKIARKFGISQMAINKRKKALLSKIVNLL